jgi:multiple sugar transport system ATP-binding protein
MANVTLNNLAKTYPGGVKAVEEFNLDIEDGEFIVLVGPSGCGKSTTLRMIAGLEEITEGTVSIGDRVVNEVEPKDRDIAMVFQNYALYPHMSVYKNMAFGLKLRKVPKKEIKQRVQDAAEILGLEDYLNRKPKALSGGQRQRVALGRAIVRDPQVFLFDEPLSNLDAKLRVQMRAEIGKLHNRLNTTMVYVTHDQVEAMTMGDKIVVMKDGVIQQVGVPMDIYDNPENRFVAGFIGSPPMNFLEGTIIDERGTLRFRDDEKSVLLTVDPVHHSRLDPYVNHDITIGIRPEMFSDRPDGEDTPGGNSITAHVDVVEPLGAETYVYVSVGTETLVARLEGDSIPTIDASHVLDVDMSRVHYFDADSEESI